MRNDLSEVVVILDRSGSMDSILADAQGGLDTFIRQQKEAPGECVFTLAEFDDHYDVPILAKPIKDVAGHKIVPRGSTALYDAVGKTIVTVGERLAAMPESERPGLVVVTIITDGMNNASKEYTAEKVKEMIQRQQDAYKWQFQYLGANQDAWAVSSGLGTAGAAGQYTNATAKASYAAGSANVMRMRSANLCGLTPTNHFTEEEVAAMTGAAE